MYKIKENNEKHCTNKEFIGIIRITLTNYIVEKRTMYGLAIVISVDT